MILHDDFEHEVFTLDFGGENRKKPRYTLTSLKSVPKSVSRKERPGTLFTCYHAKSDKVALRRKKKKLFFPRTQPIFEGKKSRKAEFFRKNRGKWPKFGNLPRFSEFFRDFRCFTAKKSVPAMQRASWERPEERPTTQRATHGKSDFSEIITSPRK